MCDWRERLLRDEAHRRVAEKVVSAVEKLLDDDKYLLEANASERSITHRLAVYLEQEFSKCRPRWHVDCEYNRDKHDKKKMLLLAAAKEQVKERVKGLVRDLGPADEEPPLPREVLDEMVDRLVYPDIIVHRRGKPNNLLVIEAKKRTSKRDTSNEWDMLKLKTYRSEQRLQYQHALFLKFTCGEGNAGVDDATTWVCETTHAG